MSDEIEKAVAFAIDNWESLGVVENDGVLHRPAEIRRREKGGGTSSVPVMLRNVTNEHRFKARKQARTVAVEKFHLDLDRDADFVQEIENYSLLAYAMRDPKTFIQHVPGVEELVKLYDSQSLAEVWGVYEAWVEMLDPRYGQLDAEQLWQVIARISKEKQISPLAGLPGPAQHTCIVAMASQALLSPNRPSWLQPSETSKQGS